MLELGAILSSKLIRGIDADRQVRSTMASRGGLMVSRFPGNRWVARVVTTLLIGGCTAATESHARGPITLRASAATLGYAPIWIDRDLQPIGQPTAVGSMMVGIIIDDHRLFLVGIAPATGIERWRQRMTSAMVTPGVAVEVTRLGDDKVAYFRPKLDGTDYAQLVVADAQTGNDLATSPQELLTSPAYACRNGMDACAISHGTAGGRLRQYRLEVATDDYLAESEGIPPGARLLEQPHLLDLGDRPGNTLGWLRDGKIQWRTPITAAFPPGFSSDYGWTWHLFIDQHVIVGSVFKKPLATGKKLVIDLASDSTTAGLSEATGEVLWRDSGSSVQCHLGNKDYPVRCRSRGLVTRQPGRPTSSEGLDVTIEGFVPATGKTTWSVPMGPAETLVNYDASLAIAGPTQVVLNSPTGPVVLDYATGDVKAPPAGATFWCMTTVTYESFPSYLSDGGSRYTRKGGQVAAICDDRGRSSRVLPSADATMAAGAYVGAYAVVAGPRGYVGFKLR